MTAILTLEHFDDLSEEITFTAELQNYVYEINVSYGGGISTGGIVLGETLTVRTAALCNHASHRQMKLQLCWQTKSAAALWKHLRI